MIIAVPVSEGRLSQHFGHCSQVALVEVAGQPPAIGNTRLIPTPLHEPGRFPAWLHAQGADVVIAGGMGQRAVDMFKESGVQVILGAPHESPEAVVTAWLQGRLQTGNNACNHGSKDGHSCDGHHA